MNLFEGMTRLSPEEASSIINRNQQIEKHNRIWKELREVAALFYGVDCQDDLLMVGVNPKDYAVAISLSPSATVSASVEEKAFMGELVESDPYLIRTKERPTSLFPELPALNNPNGLRAHLGKYLMAIESYRGASGYFARVSNQVTYGPSQQEQVDLYRISVAATPQFEFFD